MNSHGGDIWGVSRGLGFGPGEILDFSASISPAGPPEKAAVAFKNALNDIAAYPDPSSTELREALSEFYGLRVSSILPGNGSIEFIHLIPRVFASESALIVEPAFSEYRAACELEGSRIDALVLDEEDGFALAPERFARALDMGRSGLVFVANPANPTGALIKKETLIEMASLCEARSAVLVVDEAFADFVEGASIKDEVLKFKNLVVLRSMTKFFGMAGLRLGFIFAHPETIERFLRFMPPWSVNTPASRAGAAALKDIGYAQKTHAWLLKERAFLLKGLTSIEGLTPYPPAANFIMVRITGASLTGEELKARLLTKGILIRELGGFRGLGPGYFRIAVRERADNEALLRALVSEMEKAWNKDKKKRAQAAKREKSLNRRF
jgi:threonine-phosphate decarboxylase